MHTKADLKCLIRIKILINRLSRNFTDMLLIGFNMGLNFLSWFLIGIK